MKSKAAVLHQDVPADWYEKGIKRNLGQRFWHFRRFAEVGKLIEPTGGKILDIGCADGTFTKVILGRSQADLIVGIDVLPDSVAYAKKRFKNNQRLKFRLADASRLPFRADEFDAVFCLEVLEHVFLPEKVLAEVRRVLKKDGYAVFLVPTESFLFKIIWFFWLNTGGKIWRGTHVNHFYQQKLVKMIKKESLEVTKQKNFLLGMLKLIKAIKKR